MKIKLTALLLLCIFIIVGCSSNNASDTETDTEPLTPLEEIQEKGSMVVAMGGTYPPFNFMNNENELDGFDVDIAKEIAKRLGIEAEPIATEWGSIIPGLLGNKFDIILGSMAITDERKEKVNFVPYYTSGAAIVVPIDSTIEGQTDLKDTKVGVGLGTTYEAKARELGAEVTTYSSSVNALTDMTIGRIDAVVSDQLLAAHAIQKGEYDFKIVGDRLFDEYMGIAVRPDASDFQDEIQRVVDEMMEDGTYTEISEKWFGIDIR